MAQPAGGRLRIFMHGCGLGLPDFSKSFKIVVEPGFSHKFAHAEFNGAKKSDPKISRGRYFESKIWIFS